MTNKEKYNALVKELQAIERATGLYLSDENIDRENAGVRGDDESEECYAALYHAATMAAGGRAEDEGFDINVLIGRVIY